jgi:hypothetical protein
MQIRFDYNGEGGNGYSEIRKWDGSSWVQTILSSSEFKQNFNPSIGDNDLQTDRWLEVRIPRSTIDGATEVDVQFLIVGNNLNNGSFSSVPSDNQQTGWDQNTVVSNYVENIDVSPPASTDVTDAPAQSTPLVGATGVSSLASFSWETVEHATSYDVQVSTSSDFSANVVSFNIVGLTGNVPNGSGLRPDTEYFWRVRGKNGTSEGPWSVSRSFTTVGYFTVYFNNPNNWTTVNAYAFTPGHYRTWPGEAMTAPETGSVWYSYQIPTTYTQVIFNNGSGSQSADLSRNTTGYYYNETWYDENPVFSRAVTFTVDMSSEIDLGRFNTSLNDGVHVRGSFNDWSTPSASNQLQPTSEGSRVYTGTFTVVASADADVAYKFFIKTGDDRTITNEGYELMIDAPSETPQANRTFNMGDERTTLSLSTVHFNNGARTSFTLSGSQGWRFMSSPFSDRTYVQVLSGLHTQGFTGATFVPTQNAMSNLFTMNNASTQGWVALTDGTVVPTAGNGFVFGVFGKDDPSDASETWPKTRTVTGTATTGTVQVSLNDMEKFTLAGNPFLSTVDYSQTTRVGLSDVVYVYDYVTSDFVDNVDASSTSGGMFRAWNGSAGSLGSYRIAPFQGFLVYRTAETASFAIPEAAKTSTAAIFRGKEAGGAMALDAGQASVSATSALTASLEISGNGLRSSAWLHFAEEASAGLDSRDAFKLYPFSSQYALLQTYTSDGVGLDINHYPVPGATTVIALDLETTVSGTYTLRAGNWQLPDDWSVVLRDTWNGAEYRLDADAEVTLAIEAARAKVRGGSEDGGLPGVMQVSAEGAPRFALVVTPGAVTSVETGGVDVPRQVELYGNYPNPFNPVTQIQFALPVEMPVRLEVFDMLGRRVAVLHDGLLRAGTHTMAFQAGNLGSGVYVYRLEAGGSVITRKMTLMK